VGTMMLHPHPFHAPRGLRVIYQHELDVDFWPVAATPRFVEHTYPYRYRLHPKGRSFHPSHHTS